MRSNCLHYALQRWHEEHAGKLCLVSSTHWCIPHVQFKDRFGVLTQFVPPGDLPTAWQSLFGFEGFVEMGDSHADMREKMNPICTFLGTCILLVSGGVWYFQRFIGREHLEYPEPIKVPRNEPFPY